MQISNVGQVSGSPPAAPANPELTGEAFLVLLVAQLRSQNPFEPLKPSEFMNQLVQFNTLDQIIRMRQALEANSGDQGALEPVPKPVRQP